ncbi:hypothetical protein QWJ34_20855 [Saccharibacillus sp. CPCC 101409]|uniref:hypothetical protein n=1 Tax=Saccharibacillus sp. CPCC 101409 TaxID=3058041 RepID=UPI002671681B|nr:hypothetical protein [Saccharibacillus sp. CPCC 101409]MDO3412226.1 hypothetical protein [Saccharibacillus sp. CPCC 101409]
MNTQMSRKFVRSITAAALSTVVLFTGWSAPPEAHAAANAVPSYEVKFLLDSNDVLNADGTLKGAVNSAFSVASSPERQLVEYFDTDSLDLNGEGWNARFRKKESKSNYELTYKKRFAVENGKLDDALTAANAAGFDASDDNYEAEVDWGYGKQTLSFSNTKKVDASKGLVLPSESEALKLLVSSIPGKLDKAVSKGWGTKMLKASYAHGPVQVSKYAGTFDGQEVDIEVWPIRSASGTGTEPLVEISFKTDDYAVASAERAKLMDKLDGEGWLIHADSLKTNLILERY